MPTPVKCDMTRTRHPSESCYFVCIQGELWGLEKDAIPTFIKVYHCVVLMPLTSNFVYCAVDNCARDMSMSFCMRRHSNNYGAPYIERISTPECIDWQHNVAFSIPREKRLRSSVGVTDDFIASWEACPVLLCLSP